MFAHLFEYMTPQEHQRRAAVALFREIARRAREE
jgi:hypothetical protein